MTEAWQARSFEQQEFARSLAREVREYGDCLAPCYEFHIAEFLVAVLAYVAAAHRCPLPLSPSDAARQFGAMIPRIEQFCRVGSERTYVAHLLFKELECAIQTWADRDYLRDQIERPQAVFGAPSAMAEVEISERSRQKEAR